MRSTTHATPSCTLRRRRRLLVVGGFTVPAIVLGSLLGSAPAFATSPQTKADLTDAFGTATGTSSTFTLTDQLQDPSDDGTGDVQTLGGGKALTIDLDGHDLVLDQLRVGTGASLTVRDTSGGGSLVVGATVLSPGDATGIKLSPGAHLAVAHDADVTAVGSANLPGVGTTATGYGTTVTVTDGASLTARGGAGAAGIGGAGSTEVTVANAHVSATGGSGAAGIGGSTGAVGSAVTISTGATVTAQEGPAVGSPAAPASAIGAGQGSSTFGSLDIDAPSSVTVPTGATLRVPAGGTLNNHGTIRVAGTLTGAGTVANSGSIVPTTGGTVADALNVTGNDYAVTLDAGTSGTVAPTTARVLADTFADGGVALNDAVADSTHHFNGWRSGGTTVAAATSLSGVGGSAAANGAKAVTLTAAYGDQLSFTQSTDLGLMNTTTAVSVQLAANGTGTKTWSQPTAGAIPAGLTLAADGSLTGTPTAAGAFTFTVTVTGPYGTASRTYTGSVGVVPVMAGATLANATVGAAYSRTIAATSGATGTTYSAPAGSLPAGLTLASDGTLSGTPTAAAGGTTTFTVTATNAYGTDSASYTVLTHTIPVFTTTTLPSAVLGTGYTKQLAAVGDGSITFALSPSTPLPGQMHMDANGLISGTATRAGSRTITVIATSQYGSTSQDLVFVAGNVPAITTASVPDAVVGDAGYSLQLATTGDGPVTWTATGLPAGLQLSSSGLLTGPISAAGTTTFTVESTSSFGTVEKDFTITAGAKPTFSTTSIADPVIGYVYSATVSASGTGTTTYAATGLPAGLSLDAATGAISGTPTARGAATVHVTASNSWGTRTLDLPITVRTGPVWAVTSLPDVAIGAAIDQQLSAPGDGVTTYSSTNLPASLSLSSSGRLTGTVPGSVGFSVNATNAYGATERSFAISAGAAPHITTAHLAAPVLGAPSYSDTVGATGDGTLAYSVTGGALPTGLTLNASSGAITGSPSAAGSFTFVVTAASHWGTDTATYTLLVGAAPTILTTGLLNPTLGAAYDRPVVATTAGTGVTYTVTAGSLPTGLALDSSTGHVTGTTDPATTTSTFTVTVHTTYGDTSRSFTMVPGSAAHLTTTSVGGGVTGQAYTAAIAATGDGVTYAVTGGALPAGLSLSATGQITGTPTAAGTALFTVTASSAYGDDHTDYALVVAAAPSFTTPNLTPAVVGYPWSRTIATAGEGSIALHVQGALPDGIAFDAATDTLSGTATATGTATITLVAVSSYATTSHDYTFTAVAVPTIATAVLAGATVGSGYGTTAVATGDGTITWSVTSGSLPAGLSLDAATGAITGTPQAEGSSVFTLTASSEYGTASRSLVIDVAAAPYVPPYVAPPAPVVPAAPYVPPYVAPAAPAYVAPPAPVMPGATTATASAGLGHGFAFSVAASSTVAVSYAVRGSLPKGVSLDRSTGVVSGTPQEAGTFTFTVSATSAGGSAEQTYTVVVPAQKALIAATPSQVTPVMGKPFTVAVRGLLKGEKWIVQANGKTVASGKAAKAGTVTADVTLPKSSSDKTYTIRAHGSRSVSDPAKTATADFTVTAIRSSKTLKLKQVGGTVQVTGLAAGEGVTVTVDGKKAGSGRADTSGLFVFTAKSGTHKVVVTGKSASRTGKLTVR